MKAFSHQTKSQRIAELCVIRKECAQRRVRALLRGDFASVDYNTDLIKDYSKQISDLHKPPYLSKKRK